MLEDEMKKDPDHFNPSFTPQLDETSRAFVYYRDRINGTRTQYEKAVSHMDKVNDRISKRD